MKTEEAVNRIRNGLIRATGRTWSVRKESGSLKGAIRITCPRNRCIDHPEGGWLSDIDSTALARIFCLPFVADDVLVKAEDVSLAVALVEAAA